MITKIIVFGCKIFFIFPYTTYSYIAVHKYTDFNIGFNNHLSCLKLDIHKKLFIILICYTYLFKSL